MRCWTFCLLYRSLATTNMVQGEKPDISECLTIDGAQQERLSVTNDLIFDWWVNREQRRLLGLFPLKPRGRFCSGRWITLLCNNLYTYKLTHTCRKHAATLLLPTKRMCVFLHPLFTFNLCASSRILVPVWRTLVKRTLPLNRSFRIR